MKDKNKIVSALILSVIVVFSSCQGNKNADGGKKEIVTASVEISIKGMTCTGCEQTIQTGISKLKGVESVKATFTDGKAIVVYVPGETDSLKMKEAITSRGYIVNKFTQLPNTGKVPD
jgi:copper chaperone CopZ